MAAMLGGDFLAAWRESDAIRLRGAPDPHRFWSGDSLKGKRVIVRCLHGLGDAVQMLRYAPLLNSLCESVVFEVPPSLFQIAGCFRGVNRVITWGDQAPQEPIRWDVQLEIMELPYLFRTTLAQLPLERNYLGLPANLRLQTAERLGQNRRPRVGIVWAAGEWNRERSLPESAVRELLQLPDIELWSIQGAEAAADAPEYGLCDAAAVCGTGLLPLAATIANLDLVLTVDTLAAHLAGAMGCRVWIMLQYAADWRWMTEREDSPWYPSMRLFRQTAPGDWHGVVRAVSTAMAAL